MVSNRLQGRTLRFTGKCKPRLKQSECKENYAHSKENVLLVFIFILVRSDLIEYLKIKIISIYSLFCTETNSSITPPLLQFYSNLAFMVCHEHLSEYD